MDIPSLAQLLGAIWAWVNAPSNADVINGSFEIIGAIAAWMNVAAYLRHRAIQGVFWPNTLFYTSWGLWNLIYYSALSQPVSFYAGIALTSGSAMWVVLVAFDKWKARRQLAALSRLDEAEFEAGFISPDFVQALKQTE